MQTKTNVMRQNIKRVPRRKSKVITIIWYFTLDHVQWLWNNVSDNFVSLLISLFLLCVLFFISLSWTDYQRRRLTEMSNDTQQSLVPLNNQNHEPKNSSSFRTRTTPKLLSSVATVTRLGLTSRLVWRCHVMARRLSYNARSRGMQTMVVEMVTMRILSTEHWLKVETVTAERSMKEQQWCRSPRREQQPRPSTQ